MNKRNTQNVYCTTNEVMSILLV